MLKHQHVIVRAEIRRPPTKHDSEMMKGWFRELVWAIGMKILRAPDAEYCEEVNNRGFTGTVILTTSHAAIHTWDECDPAILQFDLYSCSCIEIDTVFKMFGRFDPKTIEYHFLDRDAANVCCSSTPSLACSCRDPSKPAFLKVIKEGRIVYV